MPTSPLSNYYAIIYLHDNQSVAAATEKWYFRTAGANLGQFLIQMDRLIMKRAALLVDSARVDKVTYGQESKPRNREVYVTGAKEVGQQPCDAIQPWTALMYKLNSPTAHSSRRFLAFCPKTVLRDVDINIVGCDGFNQKWNTFAAELINNWSYKAIDSTATNAPYNILAVNRDVATGVFTLTLSNASGLEAGDKVKWEGSKSNGCVGGTYQIASVSGNTVTLAFLTRDFFVKFTNYGYLKAQRYQANAITNVQYIRAAQRQRGGSNPFGLRGRQKSRCPNTCRISLQVGCQ